MKNQKNKGKIGFIGWGKGKKGDVAKPVMVEFERRRRGRKNRASGRRFELKVREDLEKKGWIVDRWTNQVDSKNDKLIPAKPKTAFIKGRRVILNVWTGFPDFIAYFWVLTLKHGLYNIIGVECKVNGKLDEIEKEKCRWLLKHKVFDKIWIAMKGEKRGEIKYKKFEK